MLPELEKLDAQGRLRPFAAPLAADVPAALDALAARSKVKGEAEIARVDVEEWKESVSRLRGSTYAELMKRAAERSLARAWPRWFFRALTESEEPVALSFRPPLTALLIGPAAKARPSAASLTREHSQTGRRPGRLQDRRPMLIGYRVSLHRIDKFIEAMHDKQAEQLFFVTGAPVCITVNGVEKVLLDKEVRTEQIAALLEPVARDRASDLGRSGDYEFYYQAPTGRVQVQVRVRGEGMSAVVSPEPESNESYDPDIERLGVLSGLERSAPKGHAASPVPVLKRFDPSPFIDGLAAPPVPALERLDSSQFVDGLAAPPAPSLARFGPRSTPKAKAAPAPTPPRFDPSPPNQHFREPQVSVQGPEGVFGIDPLLRTLFEQGGSDLHLTSGQRPLMRKDGDIQPVPGFDQALGSETIEGWVMEIAHEKARSDFRERHDADFAFEIPSVSRFRMNVFRDRSGVGLVARTIPTRILTADQLGLPSVIRSFCELPKGLVVVTGPTGSGKSTTLAAMVDLINKTRPDHIITIEDPIEFVHASQKCLVNQREVHMHTMSFAAALRAALREDPDIVLVGELRDLETVHIAIETAETGHLVFGTLHTNTAASTVDRIIDQFPTDQQAQIRVMLSESLKGVVAQTLCKKLGGGRVACLEILVVNSAISNLIREGKTFQIPSIMQTNKGQGMQTQLDAMMNLVKTKVISPQEAFAKAADQAAMRSALDRAGHRLEG